MTAPKKEFVDYYKKWYVPNRMVAIVVGDVDVEATKKLITEQFTSLKAPAVAPVNPSFGKVTTGKGFTAKLHTEKEAGQVTISVTAARPSPQLPDNTATRRKHMIRQLADSMLNRRFEVLAKKEGSPFISAASEYQDWLHFVESSSLEISAKPENWDKSLAAGEQELRRAVLHGFTKSELAEASANLLNVAENDASEASTRKSRTLADEISKGISEREVFVHPSDVLAWVKAELPKVTLEQTHEALKSAWTTEDISVFVGGNLTLEDAANAIASTWKKSRGVEVQPKTDDGEQAWAYTSFGEPGKITSQKTVEDLGITQVIFANGVRLNIKATDFSKDTIQIAASIGEGKLTAPKDKPGLPAFTQNVFEQAGLGKHSVDDLQRVLAGKTVDINFAVGDDSFSLAGKTNHKDLAEQFQLLAAFLSDPGWREDGLPRLKMSLPSEYQKMEHTPEGVMNTKVNAFTHGDDYRFVFPKQEELAARTVAEMKEWVGPQLKSGYLEIGVVGDLDVKEVIKAAAATVGALPARAAERPNQDELRKLAFPKGTAEKEFPFTSKIPKSMALVFWPTTDRLKDVKLSRRFSLLAEILSDRVRKKVREELGESYSPRVASMMSDTWPGYGQMMAMMIADAKDAKSLTEIAEKLATELAAGGVNADELERARKPILTSLVEQRRSNAYWLSTVVLPSQSKPERLDWARTMMEDFQSVTVEDLNALAKQYLKDGSGTAVRVVSTGETEEKK